MMERRFFSFILGLFVGIIYAQITGKCGDNACLCSQSSQIISCVDAGLTKVPAFSNFVRQWVRRINLRFNSIVDLARLLNQNFPKLEVVDIRNNDNYICGDIHNLIKEKGIIIESDCKAVTIPSSKATSPETSVSEPSNMPSTQVIYTTQGPGKGKITEVNVTAKIDVSSKVGCECKCNCQLAISFSAMVSSAVTSILAIIGHFIFKKIRSRFFDIPQVCRCFNAPRPASSRPRIELFTDLSQQRPSTSSRQQPIYKGPPRPDLYVNNESYQIESSDSDNDNDSSHTYEVPLPSQGAPVPARMKTPPSQPPPPPPPPMCRKNSGKGKSSTSTAPPQRPSYTPVRPASAPGSVSSTVSSRGRGRGRGRLPTKEVIGTVSASVSDPPAKNTRSSRKQTVFTSHM